jgi:hypothetical protein
MARQLKISQYGSIGLALSQTSDTIESCDSRITCLTGLNQKKTMCLMLEANSITTIITKD